MCRGEAPSCGVHSLFIRHYVPLRAPAVHGFDWYAPGCHACDALSDEFGTPEAIDASITWNGERPSPDEVSALRSELQRTNALPDGDQP